VAVRDGVASADADAADADADTADADADAADADPNSVSLPLVAQRRIIPDRIKV
jgi:hypothetical protein